MRSRAGKCERGILFSAIRYSFSSSNCWFTIPLVAQCLDGNQSNDVSSFTEGRGVEPERFSQRLDHRHAERKARFFFR